MKKSAILLVLMGLSTPLIMCQDSPKVGQTTFMGVFKINSNEDIMLSPDGLKGYKGDSFLKRAALKICLAPVLSATCFLHAGEAIANGSTIGDKAGKAFALTAAGIVLPLRLLFDSALELAVGNHASIAHQMSQSSMPEATIMNALDLW